MNANLPNDIHISDEESTSSEMISQMIRVEHPPADNGLHQNIHIRPPNLPDLMNEELPLPNSTAKGKAGSIPKEPDAQSLSSDDSGPLHPHDMWDARDGEMPQERTASLAFVAAQRLFFFSFFSVIGTLQDVSGNGNCFFYSILLGAYYNRIEPYYIQEDSESLRLVHLAQYVFANTSFRQSIHSFLQDNIMMFCSQDTDERRVHDSTGGILRDFKGRSERVIRRVSQRLIADGINFDNGCGRNYWADVNYHIPLTAMFLKTTIVVYSKSQPKDLPAT
jgi:hypothetical protein